MPQLAEPPSHLGQMKKYPFHFKALRCGVLVTAAQPRPSRPSASLPGTVHPNSEPPACVHALPSPFQGTSDSYRLHTHMHVCGHLPASVHLCTCRTSYWGRGWNGHLPNPSPLSEEMGHLCKHRQMRCLGPWQEPRGHSPWN